MIFTLGHSTHQPELFIDLCGGIGPARRAVVIDTRSHPGSNRYPWYGKDAMRSWVPQLSQSRIRYEWMPDLGGWSFRSREYATVMDDYGVDVLAYARPGVFPKGRIGVDRPGYDGPMEDRPRAWWNQGLYDYSFWTITHEFQDACDEVISRFNRPGEHCILICSEARWDKCHRSMVADYLEHVTDVPVFHLKAFVPKRPSTTRFVRHREAARPDLDDRIARYEPVVQHGWTHPL